LRAPRHDQDERLIVTPAFWLPIERPSIERRWDLRWDGLVAFGDFLEGKTLRRFGHLCAALLLGVPLIAAVPGSAADLTTRPRLRLEPGSAAASGSLVRRPAYLVRGDPASLEAAKARTLLRTGPAGSSGGRGTTSSPTVDSGFNALPNSSPLVSPSDATGSIGPDWIAAAVNVHFGIFWRAGGLVPRTEFRLNQMFRGLPDAIDTDPKVVYDPYASSFILAYLLYTSTNSWIVAVAIPDATADNPSSWCGVLIPGDQIRGDGNQVADYPGLGFTSNRVTITTNQFTTSLRFAYVQVLSMRSSQFFDCGKSPPHIVAFGGRQTDNPNGTPAFTIQPAVSYSATDARATTQYLASFQRGKLHKASHLVLWSLRKVNGSLHLGSVALSVGRTAFPPYGLQKGGSVRNTDTWWDTADLRLTTAFFDVDRNLFYTANAVKHAFADGFPVSAVRWYEASPAASLGKSKLKRDGYVGQDRSYAAWPSVATDQNGVLFVNFAQASLRNGEYLSVYADTVPVGSTIADPEMLIKPGDATYNFGAGVDRWGDYSAISRDPAPASAGLEMALFGAYAFDGTAGTTYRWRQWCATIHQV
jgi:hypothetical protein